MTKFMTLNSDISRASWHMKVSDDSFFWIFHAPSIRAQLAMTLKFPFNDLYKEVDQLLTTDFPSQISDFSYCN